MRDRFWETIPLDEMTREEWEALCDGCGRCCVLKLEDEDTGNVHYTNVTCRLFDADKRCCGSYALRQQLVQGCVHLTPERMDEVASWMPGSCAYRRMHDGRGLAAWHPLVSGRKESVVEAGIAVAEPLIPEYEVAEEDLEDHILDDDWLLEDHV
ncbi:MAG: YcgN family cysteine cluster protein [Pseudomonadota bacterium]